MTEIYKSNCCKADVRVVGITTLYYVCTKCGEACDAKKEENKQKLPIQKPMEDK